jgi:Pvc16 N-terminal domain/CarboxypepD_reg-like domain
VISDLDKTLENLFQLEFGTTLPFDLSFAIPDKNFAPISKTRNTLNCYLYEIIEDRELRRVDPVLLHNTDGTINTVLPPARIKLSYCITAWSPAQPTPGGEPQLDEHTLLSQVLVVLLKYPLLPARVLAGELAKQDPPPTMVVMPDTSKATSDFWSAIGGQLRPSLEYKVTIALAYQTPTTGPMVTTMVTSFGGEGPFYTIGGSVRDSNTPPNTLASAWVRVNETGQTYVTDENGHFLVDRIGGGKYTLTVRAVGFKEGRRSVNVPQPDGLYDVSLTHL